MGCATKDPRQEEEVKYVRHRHICSQRESTENIDMNRLKKFRKPHNLGMKKLSMNSHSARMGVVWRGRTWVFEIPF